MSTRLVYQFTGAAFFGAFAGISGYFAQAELRLFTHEIGTHRSTLSASILDVTPTLSLRAQQAKLLTCEALLAPPAALFSPPARREVETRKCASIANGIVGAQQHEPYAHFVLALVSLASGSTTAPFRHLTASQNDSQYEGWLIERRIKLQLQLGVTQTYPEFAADLAAFLTMQTGAETLARHFVQVPDTRALITRIVSEATVTDQTRFLNVVSKYRQPS